MTYKRFKVCDWGRDDDRNVNMHNVINYCKQIDLANELINRGVLKKVI